MIAAENGSRNTRVCVKAFSAATSIRTIILLQQQYIKPIRRLYEMIIMNSNCKICRLLPYTMLGGNLDVRSWATSLMQICDDDADELNVKESAQEEP